MRVNEFEPGIIFEHREIDPEAIRAQRLQELKDIAEWRARRMAAITEWSKPEAIAKRYQEHSQNADAALEAGRALSVLAKAQLEEKKADKEARKLTFTVRPAPPKAKPKLTWWQRFLAWFK